MSERSIIFSGPMVTALLAGRKTQTRRLAYNKRHVLLTIDGAQECEADGWRVTEPDDSETCVGWPPSPWLAVDVGDRLWVREAFRLDHHPTYSDGEKVVYRASVPADTTFLWRPSIHMPRWASRLTLTVTSVRVQRLQDISEEDARAEGVYWSDEFDGWTSGAGADETVDFHGSDPVVAYRKLWNRLHGPGAWDANPWVVAVSFIVERRNIDA